MKRFFAISAAVLLFVSAEAQQTVYKYWVELTDKNNNGYSIDKPEAFLSSRAIERRKKQNIAITQEDLPITAAYREGIAKIESVQVLHSSRWFNAVTVRCTSPAAADQIKKLPFVKSVRLMYSKVEFPQDQKKNTNAMMEMMMTMGSKQDADNTTVYGLGYNQIEQLKGDQMHEMGFDGKGVVIAVLDAGFYKMNEMETFNHLREEGRLLGTFDFVNMDTLVYEDDMHGMNVLSCMAANTRNKLIGTAPKASYWLLRTEDAGSEFPIEEANWVAGAEFADSAGADLINSSLGYTKYDDPTMSYSYKDLNGSSLISRAALYCARRGMIVCNAAGNEGDGSWKYVGVPADADSILTVGGIDAYGSHANFSSYGPTADGRIKPTISAKAAETTVASSKGKFYASNGTSFASPVMCGAVACLWQANPQATNMQVIDALMKSANQYRSPDNVLGYGVPDMVLANRILGGDKTFDYTRDQWLSEIPATYYNSVSLEFFSSKKQTIEVTVRDHKGRRIRQQKFELGEKEFFYYTISELPNAKKGITLELKMGGESKTYALSREE